MAVAAIRLNHAVLFVSDLERSLRFWTDAFGMQIVTREPRMDAAFLRLPRSGATNSVYGVDPAGNELEVMWMLPREEWGASRHAAPVDRLDRAAGLRRWSGGGTAGHLVTGPVGGAS